MNADPNDRNPMARVLALGDFRLLFTGAATSLLGDQFSLIATPWLVLQLTKDPLALGFVLALQGLPRALFMLMGGALTDRLSPRTVMLIASLTRFVLTAAMALLVALGAVQMWMIYAFSLAFGTVAGFAVPAENAIVPFLVQERDLQAGNSLIMGVTQLAGFVGPSLAGILIGGFAGSFTGIVLAFGVDSATFAVSAATLALIRSGVHAASATGERASLFAEIAAGMRFLWSDRALRLMVFVLTAMNFLLLGPLMVGIPVLADTRLPEGAVAFGLLMSAFSGGNLAGYLIAGALPRPKPFVMNAVLIASVASFGLVIAALGFVPSTWTDFALLLVMGLGNGYISILLFTWMQTRTPKAMLGRMMSLLMFCSAGLMPLSQAAAGALSSINLTMLFACAGGLVVLLAFGTAFAPDFRLFSASLAALPAEE